MVAENETTMTRIAHAGARKMAAQGYTYTRSEIDGWFTVTTPPKADGLPVNYNVAIYSETHSDCDCPFHANHRHFSNPTCKHIEFVRDEEAHLANIEAEAEKYNDPDYIDYLIGLR